MLLKTSLQQLIALFDLKIIYKPYSFFTKSIYSIFAISFLLFLSQLLIPLQKQLYSLDTNWNKITPSDSSISIFISKCQHDMNIVLVQIVLVKSEERVVELQIF